MQKTAKILIVALMVSLSVGFSSGPVGAEEPYEKTEVSAGTMIFDLVFARPFGLLSTGLGTATFVLTLPFSALGGNTGEALEKLVKEPFKYTFQRPVGKI